MAALRPWPREVRRTEHLDRAEVPRDALRNTLRDLARLNALGPRQALFAQVAPFLARHDGVRPFRILDAGTGGADIPAALVRWARRRGRRVTVIGLDLRPDVLECAAAVVRGLPEVRLLAGDALRPPLRPESVDLALCSLTLHHVAEAAAVDLLRWLATVARLGFIVSDLWRSRPAYAAAWLATRLLGRSPLTRHDGPLSVRRAFTRVELERLAAEAGVPVRWRLTPYFRFIGVHVRR